MAVSAIFMYLGDDPDPAGMLLRDLGRDYVFDGEIREGRARLIGVSSVEEEREDLTERINELLGPTGSQGDYMESQKHIERSWYRPRATFSDGDSGGVVLENIASSHLSSSLASRRMEGEV